MAVELKWVLQQQRSSNPRQMSTSPSTSFALDRYCMEVKSTPAPRTDSYGGAPTTSPAIHLRSNAPYRGSPYLSPALDRHSLVRAVVPAGASAHPSPRPNQPVASTSASAVRTESNSWPSANQPPPNSASNVGDDGGAKRRLFVSDNLNTSATHSEPPKMAHSNDPILELESAPLRSWSKYQVAQWLESLGSGQGVLLPGDARAYAETGLRNNVLGSVLATEGDEEQWQSRHSEIWFGVSNLGHKYTVWKALRQLAVKQVNHGSNADEFTVGMLKRTDAETCDRGRGQRRENNSVRFAITEPLHPNINLTVDEVAGGVSAASIGTGGSVGTAEKCNAGGGIVEQLAEPDAAHGISFDSGPLSPGRQHGYTTELERLKELHQPLDVLFSVAGHGSPGLVSARELLKRLAAGGFKCGVYCPEWSINGGKDSCTLGVTAMLETKDFDVITWHTQRCRVVCVMIDEPWTQAPFDAVSYPLSIAMIKTASLGHVAIVPVVFSNADGSVFPWLTSALASTRALKIDRDIALTNSGLSTCQMAVVNALRSVSQMDATTVLTSTIPNQHNRHNGHGHRPREIPVMAPNEARRQATIYHIAVAAATGDKTVLEHFVEAFATSSAQTTNSTIFIDLPLTHITKTPVTHKGNIFSRMLRMSKGDKSKHQQLNALQLACMGPLLALQALVDAPYGPRASAWSLLMELDGKQRQIQLARKACTLAARWLIRHGCDTSRGAGTRNSLICLAAEGNSVETMRMLTTEPQTKIEWQAVDIKNAVKVAKSLHFPEVVRILQTRYPSICGRTGYS